MTLAVAEALIATGHQDLGAIMAAISQEFVAWLRSPENDRSPGGACLYGARQLEAGVPWWKSGKPNSKGCGAAMRVAPIGFLYQHDLPKLRQVAAASALVTHHHPTAQLGAVAAAFLVKLALDRLPPEEMLPALELETHGQVREFDQALARLEEALEMTSPDAALAHIGEGWVAEEAVRWPSIVSCKSPDDFLTTIRRGANTQGDSDSIACIAGGISGAYLGVRALPAGMGRRAWKSPITWRTSPAGWPRGNAGVEPAGRPAGTRRKSGGIGEADLPTRLHVSRVCVSGKVSKWRKSID